MWVLVVDDEPLVGRTLSNLIRRRLGLDVRFALDPAGALEAIGADGTPVAIVMDYDLGGGRNGADLLAVLRGRCDAPVACAFCSGSPPPRGIDLPWFCKARGIDDLVAWLTDVSGGPRRSPD